MQNMKKRMLSLLLAMVMVLGLIPAAFATGTAEDTVYLSVSYDGQYKTGSDGTPMAYVPVKLSELSGIDLDSYNMSDYKYDADGDGVYEITALHLYIYAQEKLMGLKWSDVGFSGAAGSIYFTNSLFGIPDANLNYYYNGAYPIDEKMSADWGYTVGATADHIVLKNGDCLDVAGFNNDSWMIYGATFRFFTDGNKVARSYCVNEGETLSVNISTIGRSWSSSESTLIPEAGSAIYYNQTAFAADAATVTTDDSGNATLTFDKAGKWYIWSYGYNDGSVSCSPAYAEVTVSGTESAEITAYWSNFRNSLYNMAITDAKTPVSAATTVAKWTVAKGTSWSDTPSGMIIADNALIFMGQTSITKADLQTGEVLATNTMSSGAGFAIISPTYGDGLVFCPLSGGKMEAFDVKTLESKWTFKDELGGQNNTPITYYDGYVYTGYWNGEAKDGNFVCVNATTGELVWSKTTLGGHYWAGSTVIGDAVIVGTDDGATGWTGDSHLYALNRLTGEVISDITLTGMGDQRSSIAYSAEKGRVYFTTKNGYIASAAVDATTGALSDLKSNQISTQATATPVVYGDKVYVGAGGGMQVGETKGNLFAVNADTLEYLYEVPLKGYPQGSILISTAYLEETGKLYCYSTYNSQPGGMTLIKIDPNATTAEGTEVEEIFDAADHPQYCLISPICGPDGTIYYRNDSGCLFALSINNAYLTGLSASAGTFTEEFVSNRHNYELIVPIGTQSVTLTPTACEGGSTQAVTVTLIDGVATAEITVLKDGYSRSYTVSIREISADTTLGNLKVNQTNSYGGSITPDFTAEQHYYSYLTAGENRSFMNVWPDAADSNATVKLYPLTNATGKNESAINEDGSMKVTAKNGGHSRYAVYFVDDTKPMAVRIEVIAENGDVANYYVVISKEAAAADGEALLESLKNCDHSNCTVTGAYDATCTQPGYSGDKTCSDCGTVISGAAMDALGHDYQDGICSRCGDRCLSDVTIIVPDSLTLGEDGVTYYGLQLFQNYRFSFVTDPVDKDVTVAWKFVDSYNNTQHSTGTTFSAMAFMSGKCTLTLTVTCGDVTIEKTIYITDEVPHTHSYEAVVTAPTCTEAGCTTYTCSCGDSYTADEISALGHAYKDGYCIRCNEKNPNYATAEGNVEIFVTIADKGNVVLFQQSITVLDVNHNGIFDVDDALFAAHEAAYEGGAAAGYTSEVTQYGLGIAKLWGDTSYCYGYWLNNASCWSLEDAVAQGNHLVAFVYSDGAFWSDAYAKFDQFNYSVTASEGLTVKLDKAGYDENWNTVFSAHAGATITVYGEDGKALTEGYVVTDHGDGTYTVTVEAAGSYYIVATDADPLTVPAVAALTILTADPVPPTGDGSILLFVLVVMSISALAVLTISKKKRC